MTPFNVVLIETTNTCTRRCRFCKFGQDRRDDGKATMKDAMIARIAYQLSELDYDGRISPFGINEPLLDSRMPSIVKLFKVACPNAFISLNTNGDLLTFRLFQQLIESGLDALGISIYDDHGMARSLEYQTYPQVILIDMRSPDVYLENRGGEVKTLDHQPLINLPCHRPDNMLVIRATGDVVLCCADMFGDVTIGNVMEQSLIDLWFDPVMEHYRTQLRRDRHGLKLCESCSHQGFTSSRSYPMKS